MSDLDLRNYFWRECTVNRHLSCYEGFITRCQPYSLSDDSTRLVTHLASGASIEAKLATYRYLARLPFDEMWIEVDYDARYNAKKELNVEGTPEQKPEDTPDRIGWMLKSINDTTWRATTVCRFDRTKSGRQADTFGITYIISTDGPVQHKSWARDPLFRTIINEFNEADTITAALWGFTARNQDGKLGFAAPAYLKGALKIDLDPSWETILNSAYGHLPDTERAKKSADHLINSARELMGDVRFLLTALATINQLPTSFHTDRPQGSARIGGRIRQYMINRVVTIEIPKSRNMVTKALKLLKQAEVRIRRHLVSGHWRRIRQNGEIKMVWIEQHYRGDASLGYVRQVREVVTA